MSAAATVLPILVLIVHGRAHEFMYELALLVAYITSLIAFDLTLAFDVFSSIQLLGIATSVSLYLYHGPNSNYRCFYGIATLIPSIALFTMESTSRIILASIIAMVHNFVFIHSSRKHGRSGFWVIPPLLVEFTSILCWLVEYRKSIELRYLHIPLALCALSVSILSLYIKPINKVTPTADQTAPVRRPSIEVSMNNMSEQDVRVFEQCITGQFVQIHDFKHTFDALLAPNELAESSKIAEALEGTV